MRIMACTIAVIVSAAATIALAADEDPAVLAHDFTELSCALFYRAIWSRIGRVS